MKRAEHAPALQRPVIEMIPAPSRGSAIGLLLVVLIVCVACATPRSGGAPPLGAIIRADCAPWDGSAFTVSIPYGSGGSIDVSIWQAPAIERPIAFSFPDPTGRTGNAVYRMAGGDAQRLRGTVSFGRVERGHSVEGGFALASERGTQFTGRFEASWGNTVAMCG